jgi:hypothetical protein
MAKFWNEIKKQYSEEVKYFKETWKNAEGFTGIFASPYFHTSLFFTIAASSQWRTAGWWDNVFSIIPNLIGFSIGSYTLLWSINNAFLKRAMVKAVSEDGRSAYLSLHAIFLRFILMQVWALLLALLSQLIDDKPYGWFTSFLQSAPSAVIWIFSWLPQAFWFISYLIFIYALSLSVSCAMAVYRISRLERLAYLKEIEEEKMAAEKAALSE